MPVPHRHHLFFLLLLLLQPLLLLALDADPQLVLQPTTAILSPGTHHSDSDPTTALPAIGSYTHLGCWNGTANSEARAIEQGRKLAHEAMTTTMCLSFCQSADHTHHSDHESVQYAALKNGRDCYCHSSLSSFPEKLDPSARCTSPCAGDSAETCGGDSAVTIYSFTFSTHSTTAGNAIIPMKVEDAIAADEPTTAKFDPLEDGSQTGIAWSKFAGAPVMYGMLAAITLVIAAVI